MFDLNSDTSVPTWYASVTLLLCAILLGAIGFASRGARPSFALHWLVMAAIFLGLSVDEVARIHETTGRTLALKFGSTRGFLNYTWVIPGSLFVLVFVLSYARFLLHLPTATRYLFVLAGSVFVIGALGVEMINAYIADLPGPGGSFVYEMVTALEEFLEMSGILIFIYALMSHLASVSGNIAVRVSGGEARG